MNKWLDILTKEKIGHLSNFKYYGKNKYGHVLIHCKCNCGSEVIRTFISIKDGYTNKQEISCGCVQKQKARKTGLSNRKYIYDLNIPDCPDKSYIIGLYAADGYNNNNGVYISLQKQDVLILQKIKDFFKFTGNIKEKIVHNSSQYKLEINGIDISNFFKKEGIFNNKTENLVVIDKYKDDRDFWRGFIDGDGCIYSYDYEHNNLVGLSLVGTKSVMVDFKNFCSKLVNTNNNTIHKVKNTIIYKFTITGKRAAIVLNYLYNDSNLFIDRKKKKVDEINTKLLNLEKKKEKWGFIQLDKNENFIRQFNNKKEILKSLGEKTSISNIRLACRKKTMSYGYRWKEKN